MGALAVILDVFGSPKLKPLILLGFSYDWECPRSKSRAKVGGNYVVSGALEQSIFKTSDLEIKTSMIELIALIELIELISIAKPTSQPEAPSNRGAGGYLVKIIECFYIYAFLGPPTAEHSLAIVYKTR